mgnify:FL=1
MGVFHYLNLVGGSYGGSSPRAWGCFEFPRTVKATISVFPTCVGVFLETSLDGTEYTGLPHVRGGVSEVGKAAHKVRWSSPRAWGCFSLSRPHGHHRCVFPTCVGVFLCSSVPGCSRCASSPRAWGCFSVPAAPLHASFVFPTCVGVFLMTCVLPSMAICLPHVRGGVSTILHIIMIRFGSSPRAWGCFSTTGLYTPFLAVFPTCVGVFPSWSRKPPGIFCLPHVRGGVSTREDYYRIRSLSSPRAWGCFLNPWNNTNGVLVFPTCVGVFPTACTTDSP